MDMIERMWRSYYPMVPKEVDPSKEEYKRMQDVASFIVAEICLIINRFQDIYGWQPGESRNQLIVDIQDRVRSEIFPPKSAEERVTVEDYPTIKGWSVIRVDGLSKATVHNDHVKNVQDSFIRQLEEMEK